MRTIQKASKKNQWSFCLMASVLQYNYSVWIFFFLSLLKWNVLKYWLHAKLDSSPWTSVSCAQEKQCNLPTYLWPTTGMLLHHPSHILNTTKSECLSRAEKHLRSKLPLRLSERAYTSYTLERKVRRLYLLSYNILFIDTKRIIPGALYTPRMSNKELHA